MRKTGWFVTGMFLLIAFSSLFVNTPEAAAPPMPPPVAIPEAERQALLDLYSSTTGTGYDWINSTNWNGAPGTECIWFGVGCSIDGHVLSINLQFNNLTGSLPASLQNLTALQILDLTGNNLTGQIPPQLGNLSDLRRLGLWMNALTGGIPQEIGNLRKLTTLDFGSNQLTGQIPAWIGYLTNLQNLYFDFNQFTGSIPSSLGNLVNLHYLLFTGNHLNGPIPSSLGNLSNLLVMDLSMNNLMGPIPSSLMNLHVLGPSGLNISYNGLYTSDPALAGFLSTPAVDPAWAFTQTVAPADLAAGLVTDSTVSLTWTPIVYTADTGGYDVQYSLSPAGCYGTFGTTPDKLATGMTVTGLLSGTPYYFQVRTFTNSHAFNSNKVISEFTPPLSVVTTGAAPASSARTTIAEVGAPGFNYTSFGSSNVNVGTAAKVLTVSNTGVSSLDITGISLGGTDPSDFTLDVNGGSSPCGSAARSLAPGASCTVSAAFLPGSTGGKWATVDVASNAVNNCGGVVGYYLAGEATMWSGNHVPSVPMLATPAQGQEGIGTSVDLTWWHADDADNDSLSYRIVLCDNQSLGGCAPVNVAASATKGLNLAGLGGMGLLLIGSALIVNPGSRRTLVMLLLATGILCSVVLSACRNNDGGAAAPVAGDMTYHASGLTAGTTYYWKVIADDGKGGISESSMSSFRTN